MPFRENWLWIQPCRSFLRKLPEFSYPRNGLSRELTQQTLGENVRVVSAFHNVAAAHLRDGIGADEGDVLVFGNDKDAREIVVSLADDLGLKAWHAGWIDNSVVGEALTSVLIFLNKRYKIDGAGIRITGEAD